MEIAPVIGARKGRMKPQEQGEQKRLLLISVKIALKIKRGVGSTVMSAIRNSGYVMKIETTVARDCAQLKGVIVRLHINHHTV